MELPNYITIIHFVHAHVHDGLSQGGILQVIVELEL